ncbi:hypothetical protein B0T21DRAFT_379070 [Apiosordaria backusii]|uniref:Uncharacterized protein n=1 Tax=Apiosordaria backusii TaxID=314023 RepID=A0AA40DHU6_9PEZI|nr:hypothetical protein B0T21DRAFT_379070 [Apiosordaria backusii]
MLWILLTWTCQKSSGCHEFFAVDIPRESPAGGGSDATLWDTRSAEGDVKPRASLLTSDAENQWVRGDVIRGI